MFKHAYHGGTHVELLSTAGKTPLKDWKQEGKIVKEYDKEMKSSLFHLTEQSRLSIPQDEKDQLGLIQQFLCLQVLLLSPHVSIELAITDSQRVSPLFNEPVVKTEDHFPPRGERDGY